MKTGQLIVVSHRPWVRRVLLIGGWLGLLLVIVGAYGLGQYRAGYNLVEAVKTERQLSRESAELNRLNQTLREQITLLERTQSIDRESFNVVRNDLKQLQEEILELRGEVEFYRGIVSPDERMAGLDIQTFKLLPAVEEGLYHFELVVSQVLKNDRYVQGGLKLQLQGVLEGEPQTLDFRDLSPNNSVPQEFRFRYFQKMDGDIRLPQNFIPRSVLVELSPKGRQEIGKTFPWAAAGG